MQHTQLVSMKKPILDPKNLIRNGRRNLGVIEEHSLEHAVLCLVALSLHCVQLLRASLGSPWPHIKVGWSSRPDIVIIGYCSKASSEKQSPRPVSLTVCWPFRYIQASAIKCRCTVAEYLASR